MGRKLVDELREKVRKKHGCVIEESRKLHATLSSIQNRVATINKEATAAADSIIKEKNKEKLKARYTEVMQQLEQCSNVLFLINSSLPGDAEEEGDSTSSSDGDDEDPVGGATSTPQCSYRAKPDLSPSFIPDTSSQFTLQDTSKLGLTAFFKEDGAVIKEEVPAVKGEEVVRNGEAPAVMEEEVGKEDDIVVKQEQESREVSTLKQQESGEEIKGEEVEGTAVVKLEESPSAAVLSREENEPALSQGQGESQAAAVLKDQEGDQKTEGEDQGVSVAPETIDTAPTGSTPSVGHNTQPSDDVHGQKLTSGDTESSVLPEAQCRKEDLVEVQEQGEDEETHHIETVSEQTQLPPASNTSNTNQPEPTASQQHTSNTHNNKPVPQDRDTSQTSKRALPRAESPVSDRSETRSVKSMKSDKVHPKRVAAKAPSTKTLPSSRASSVAGETLEPSGRIPPLEILPDKEYEVYVQMVESPWLLWVQPFSEEFDDLIDNMNVWYEQLGPKDARQNLDGPPVVGMYVCARYSANGDWYRAIVTDIYQLKGEESRVTHVRVFYVDFANSEDRSVEDLRPLLRKFCELPAHAVPCALAEVAPLADGTQWTQKEAMAVLLTLKADKSVGLKHAVFIYEPGCPLWFVHIYVPQAVPQVPAHARSGPITQEMICVSYHLVNTKLARRLPNAKSVKQIKRMKLTESVSHDERYITTGRMDSKSLISTLSPLQPRAGDGCTAEWEEGTANPVPGKTNQAPRDRGDSKQAEAKSHKSPAASENPPNQSKTQGQRSNNKQTEIQANLYQEWAHAWKKVSDPEKEKKLPAVQCSTSLSSSTHHQGNTKTSPQNLGVTDPKTSEQTSKSDQSSGIKASSQRPASDHQHVRIPSAEISVGPDQRVVFLMSHIESPGLFFIHPVAEKTQQLIDSLAEQLDEYYREANLETMQRYFHSANLEVHDACVAFYSEDNNYYRAEILNTSRTARASSVSGDSVSSGDLDQVEVLYVDYGNREWVSLNKVYPIQPKLSSVPAQAVCCRLSHVVPAQPDPEVTLSYDHGGWLMAAVQWFTSNTGYNKHFVGTLEETGGIKHCSITAPLPMLLVDESEDQGARCLNLELARLGMAQITELPQMSTLSLGSSQKAPTARPRSPVGTENSVLDEWRPMEEDFLSIRNSYQIDTEDAGVALDGHKCVGDQTICRYYARGVRCWLGALCRDKHVRTNPDMCEDQVSAVVMYSDENVVALPEPKTWVRLEVLCVINPSRFYGYLPYGVLPIHADIDCPPANEEFLKMRDLMTEFYEEHPFEHQDLTLYAEGEIVAAKCDDDHYWYRCRVIEVDPDNNRVKVFFLDFGTTVWQQERSVKQIDTQFLFVPFQAIEFHLEIKPTGDTWTTQAIHEFVSFVEEKELVALVLERFGTRLTVDLYDTTNEKAEVNVADRFIQLGHARRIIPPNATTANSGSKRNKRYRMVPG